MIFSHLQSPSVLPVLPFSKIKGGRVPPSERVNLESQPDSDSQPQANSEGTLQGNRSTAGQKHLVRRGGGGSGKEMTERNTKQRWHSRKSVNNYMNLKKNKRTVGYASCY